MDKKMKLRKTISIALSLVFILSFLPPIVNQAAESRAVLSSGEYYIKNVKSNRYVDIKDQSMQNGTIIHQWTFHGHWTQLWSFIRQTNGYYTISSVVSGTRYYLSVQNGSSADGTPIVLKSATNGITDDMLWAISTTSSGNYKISPKVGESLNRIMAVVYNGTDQSANGLQIKELTYSNDGYHSDEWTLLPSWFLISPKHYYDAGFPLRNQETTPLYLIEVCQQKSAERFLSIFQLRFSPTYQSYTSIADQCKITNYGSVSAQTLNADCPHTSNCLSTASIRSNMINLFGSGTCVAPKITWTGHRAENNARSNSSSTSYTIVVTPAITINDTGNLSTKIIENTFTIHHEMSHQLGAHDHYCYGIENGDSCRNIYCDTCNGNPLRNCVMSRRYNIDNLSDDAMYCYECISNIYSHLFDYHY